MPDFTFSVDNPWRTEVCRTTSHIQNATTVLPDLRREILHEYLGTQGRKETPGHSLLGWYVSPSLWIAAVLGYLLLRHASVE